MNAETYDCKLINNTVRCSCGGQVAVGAMLKPCVDFGFGFKGNKLTAEAKYGKKTIGYNGFCMKCRKEGNFILPKDS